MPVNAFHRGPPKSLSSAAWGPVSRIVVSVMPLYCFACCTAVAAIGSGRGRGGCERLPRRHEERDPQRRPPLRGVPTSSGVRAGRTRPQSHAPQTTRRRRQACLTTFHLARCMTALASDHSALEGSLSSSGIGSDPEPRLRVEEAQRRWCHGHVDDGLRRCLGTDREPPDECGPACGPEPVEVGQS